MKGKLLSDPGNCSVDVFCFFFFLKYSPPDPSVLLLSESDREQADPGYFLFFFAAQVKYRQ